MKNINICIGLASVGNTLFLPVPCRGNVHSVRVVNSAALGDGGLMTVSRGDDAVNLVTVPSGIIAGVTVDGVPDTTNKAMIFDPASATAANRVIKIVTDATFSDNATAGLSIVFDDSAYVEQPASEA